MVNWFRLVGWPLVGWLVGWLGWSANGWVVELVGPKISGWFWLVFCFWLVSGGLNPSLETPRGFFTHFFGDHEGVCCETKFASIFQIL